MVCMEGLNGKGKKRFEHWPVVGVGLAVYDALVVNLAYFLALWLRYDCQFSAIPADGLRWLGRFAPLYTPVCLAIFWQCRMYRDRWRHAGDRELLQAVLAVCLACAAQILGVWALFGRMPAAYYAMGALLQLLAVLLPRLLYCLVWGILHPEKAVREIPVEELLGREPVKMNTEEALSFLRDKTVLVTGAGGLIGGELCRQIAGCGVKKLILFDIRDDHTDALQRELKEQAPQLDLGALVGSVQDDRRLEKVFSQYRPQVVFHGAAYSAAQVLEGSPWEAVKNNVLGTHQTAWAAMAHGCQRFVLVSADEAAKPSGVMGASRRLSEMILEAFDRMIREGRSQELTRLHSRRVRKEPALLPEDVNTEFVAARLGNVLESSGSAVAMFQRQIAQGGPVTVPDPEAACRLMTAQEAVGLILYACAHAKDGEIFALDMGEPVNLDAQARKLIQLSGHRPDQDISIADAGHCPAEEPREEGTAAEEGSEKTSDSGISICRPVPFDAERLLARLPGLMKAAYEERGNARERLLQLVSDPGPAEAEGEDSGEDSAETATDSEATPKTSEGPETTPQTQRNQKKRRRNRHKSKPQQNLESTSDAQ